MTSELNLDASNEDGTDKVYYENGSLKSTVNYGEGKKKGIEEVFYKNGTIKQRHHYLNGIMFGDQYWYDSLGTPVKYQFNNIEGAVVFTLDLNSWESSGTPIYHIYNRGNLLVDDTLESLFYVAVPEDFQHQFFYHVIDESLNVESIESTKILSFHKKLKYANVYSIDRHFNKSGNYRIETILSYSDSLKSQFIRDSTSFDVKVN